MDNHKWAEREVKALIRAGVNPLDAQRSVTWTLQHMPVGADPATWIPTMPEVMQPLDKVAEQDALTVWFERSPAKTKRLLSAGVK